MRGDSVIKQASLIIPSLLFVYCSLLLSDCLSQTVLISASDFGSQTVYGSPQMEIQP
jgi:hypothetical protein